MDIDQMTAKDRYALSWANWMHSVIEGEVDLDLAADIIHNGDDLLKEYQAANESVAAELRVLCFHLEQEPCPPCRLADRLEVK
jgi:hypothetical protein